MAKQYQPFLDEGPRDDAVGKHVCESDIASKFLGPKFFRGLRPRCSHWGRL